MEAVRRTYSRSSSAIQRGKTQGSRASNDSPRKRSYQRDHSSRKNHWQSKDCNEASPDGDLRSPCHKHPRFKGKKDSTPTDKPKYKGPWSKKIESTQQDTKKTVFENNDFPPLGFNIERFTPETNKGWANIVEEEEQSAKKQSSKENQKPQKFKRRLLLSASDSSESDTTTKNVKREEDKTKSKVLRPMITDPHKLAQRQKQIDIGKNTYSYGHYIKTVPRLERSKDDPWTPDKFQQCSTRSWVGQIKVWRRRLHSYDLSSETKEDLFSTSSSSSSQATEDISIDEEPKQAAKSIEDMFEGFDLDSCLQDDTFPL